MLLRQLQNLLAGLYDAPADHDVYDFLITDAAHAAALAGTPAPPGTDEQLLVAEDEEGVELSLYVDQAVLERLGEHCPLRSLSEENLADYCTALEGVSHFHYFVWSAGRERTVSLLELELQAEVDKYASALRLMLEQRAGRFPGELFERLFERVAFLPTLSADRAWTLRGGASLRGAILPPARGALPEAPASSTRSDAGGAPRVLPARTARQAASRGAVALSHGAYSSSFFSATFLRSSIHFESSFRFFFFLKLCLPSAPLLYGL